MARITLIQYKQALKARYLDLKESIRQSTFVLGIEIDYDDTRLSEMRAIASIAKLHGVDIKDG